MPTLSIILEELKNVPVDKLQDLYSIIHSFRVNSKNSGDANKKILSFAGVFSDMSQDDYDDLTKDLEKTKTALFDRDTNL